MKSGLILPNMPMPLPVTRQRPSRPALSVLYFPGYPPMGSTIYDFSNTFADSGILTNEELDNAEVDITVSPDATTAIPVGSTIRIDSEQMLVSATGLTLTVTRGYNGTTPATHVTTSTILRKTTNHGTITGATWVRNNRGIWGLNFDGVDDIVTVTDDASIQNIFASGGYAEAWIKATSDGENDEGRIFGKLKWILYLYGEAAGKCDISLNRSFTNTGSWYTTGGKITIGQWTHVRVTYNDSATTNDPIFELNGVVTTFTEGTTPSGVAVSDAGNNLGIGNTIATNATFAGEIALPLLGKGTAPSGRYQQTRALFGV